MRDAAQLAWVVNLGCVDLNPHPVRSEDLDHPDELRIDLDPVPGVRVAADRRGRPGRPGGARRPRPHRLAEDLGLARDSTSTPGSRRGGPSPRYGAPPRRSPARSSAARPTWRPAAGGRRSGRACSSTTTRTPRTARSPRPTRSAPTPDARVSTPLAWDEVAGLPAGPIHPRHGARPLRRARRPLGGHGRGGRAPWTACSSSPSGSARPSSRPRARAAARRRCRSSRSPGPAPRTRRWPGWSAGRPATPRSRPASSPPTSSSTAMRGRSSIWYPHPGQPAARARGRAAAAGAARGRLRPVGRPVPGRLTAPRPVEPGGEGTAQDDHGRGGPADHEDRADHVGGVVGAEVDPRPALGGRRGPRPGRRRAAGGPRRRRAGRRR